MVLKIIEWYRVGIIVFILEHKSRGASHRVGGKRLGESYPPCTFLSKKSFV